MYRVKLEQLLTTPAVVSVTVTQWPAVIACALSHVTQTKTFPDSISTEVQFSRKLLEKSVCRNFWKVYKLDIIHSVDFNFILTVRQNVQFNNINCAIPLS
jgi:hypothetical protein